MCVCVGVCLYIYIYIYTSLSLSLFNCMCIYIYMYMYVSICIYVSMYAGSQYREANNKLLQALPPDDQRPHTVYIIGDWGGVLYGRDLKA